MTAGDEKPLFYDLYMRPGAIYWLQQIYPPGRDGESDIMAWDINYFSFDFLKVMFTQLLLVKIK